MKKSVLVFVVAAALVSGCSKDDKSAPAGSELIKLKSVAYTLGASTRAPFEKPIGVDNELKALVPSTVTAGDYANPHAVGTMTFKEVDRAAAYNEDVIGNPSFPEGVSQVHAFGVYPATGWTLNATSLTGYTFDGKTDVLGAIEVPVDKDAVNINNAPTLAFNHLLTKLSVKFEGEADVVTTLGTIKSVELVAEDKTSEVNNAVSFASTGATTFAPSATAATTALPFYVATDANGYTDTPYTNQAYQLTGTPTLQAYALVAPVDVTAALDEKAYTLKVVRTASNVVKEAEYVSFDLTAAGGGEFVGNTAGKAFTVTILYTHEGIVKTKARVENWVNEGESHGGIKAPAN